MNDRQSKAIENAYGLGSEDSWIGGKDGKWYAYFDAFERHAGVPQALQLCELHRAFVNDAENAEYKKAVSHLHSCMRFA